MKNIFKNKKLQWILSVIVVSFLLSTITVGVQKVLATARNVKPSYENLRTFSEVLEKIRNDYIDEVTYEKLVVGAINGMLATLDPHSSYMGKPSYKEMRIETDGEFGGLGIEITIRDNILTVVSPIEGTPADKVGVKAGDKIYKVDGVTTKSMTLTEAVSKMRGLRGTKVTITVIRKGLDKPKDFTIVRDIIKLKSVKFKKLEKNIGYVRISKFSKSTGDDLEKAVSELRKEGDLSGLVLDVRNNPGGLLSQAVQASDVFLDKGHLIVYTKGRKKNQNLSRRSHSRPAYTDFPMVVLVNAGSASASEIVAGALQDTKRAIVLGTQTFGKGSVQTIFPLKDESALRLTTARYYTPSGKIIQENGITPDIIVEEAIIPIPKEGDKNSLMLREKDLRQHLIGKKAENAKNKAEKIKEKKDNDDKDASKKEGKDDKKIKTADKGKDKEKPKELTEKEKRDKAERERMERDVQLKSAIQLLKGWNVINKGTYRHSG